MVEINDFLKRRDVIARLRAPSKKHLMHYISAYASESTGLPAKQIFSNLTRRERLGTTGVGNGIAIPHAKMEALDGPYALFATLEQPIDFDAIDDRPVDLILMLLSPEYAGTDMLRALAGITRVLRDKRMVDDLKQVYEHEGLYELMIEFGMAQC